MLVDAKDHVSTGYEKFLTATGVNTQVSNRNVLCCKRRPASLLRTRWTSSSDPRGTLLWERDSLSMLLDKPGLLFTCTTEVKSLSLFSSAEQMKK